MGTAFALSPGCPIPRPRRAALLSMQRNFSGGSDDMSMMATPRLSEEPESSSDFARFLHHAQQLEESARGPASLRAWLDLAESWRIIQVLRDCKGNRSAAARALGIGRRTLYAKMDKLGIEAIWTV
jgi:DNA-binding NtrC family response regulator